MKDEGKKTEYRTQKLKIADLRFEIEEGEES
jgi:hypothetical protein